ncbi:hypothetical protein [Cytobacillus massiliigabonensis]|uniref:hypothetical protein n=1 Tax=Cytobacillus massiliigabonensis TaxID=1871011 RepID=UPI000C857D67|nr:hypothetical protein [Cytobacillus massiliigabonensis]
MLANIGVPSFVLMVNIILLIVGLLILFIVVSSAVKTGINKSEVGQFFEKKSGVEEKRKSFLDRDLDNDK